MWLRQIGVSGLTSVATGCTIYGAFGGKASCFQSLDPFCQLSLTLLTSVRVAHRRRIMTNILRVVWFDDEGQDIAEYAVMLAVILVIVVGTIRLVGGNANNVFSSVASSVQ